MEKKVRGWKKGIMSKDLTSAGGSIIKKGEEVIYKRIKSVRDTEGFLLTKYEWWYQTDNTLIRTLELTIESEPHIKEEILK